MPATLQVNILKRVLSKTEIDSLLEKYHAASRGGTVCIVSKLEQDTVDAISTGKITFWEGAKKLKLNGAQMRNVVGKVIQLATQDKN